MAMGLVILGLVRFATKFLGTAKPKKGKYDPYECGVPLLGSARERFEVRFYLVAILFVLFDIETVFLLPYAVSYQRLGMAGLGEILVFVAVLGLGLLYLVKRGALEWE
ncbi:MAG: NADH-quinone oxidoreductase subunit A [Planctomycetota bacterium]|nr:NADH-quinone oxidoreductase subunit A [Planctomycetota bacterium]